MTIKSKKARSKNLLYFTSDFVPDQDCGCELKCHLIASPEPYGLTSKYILHDLQLDDIADGITADESLYMNLRYRHKEDHTQVLVCSIVFPPQGDFFIDYVLLHCGQSDAKDLNFRTQACDSVKEILQLVLNRQKGEHCATCAHKFKLRLSGKCGELYERNRCLRATG